MTLTSKSSGIPSTALKFSSHRNPKAWLRAKEGRGKGSRQLAALFQARAPLFFQADQRGDRGQI